MCVQHQWERVEQICLLTTRGHQAHDDDDQHSSSRSTLKNSLAVTRWFAAHKKHLARCTYPQREPTGSQVYAASADRQLFLIEQSFAIYGAALLVVLRASTRS